MYVEPGDAACSAGGGLSERLLASRAGRSASNDCSDASEAHSVKLSDRLISDFSGNKYDFKKLVTRNI